MPLINPATNRRPANGKATTVTAESVANVVTPVRRLAHALAPHQLLFRHVVGIILFQQCQRIRDQALVAGGEVEHVQAVDGVVARPAANEHDPLAVG